MRIFPKDLLKKKHEKISETDLKHVINGSNFQPRSHLGPWGPWAQWKRCISSIEPRDPRDPAGTRLVEMLMAVGH